ncbi:MAG: hypothetical protein DDT23_00360 [candidate division WS2 bacterium]|nr:hypothetical protein [Candidatus Lithacetigena glycinireducens]
MKKTSATPEVTAASPAAPATPESPAPTTPTRTNPNWKRFVQKGESITGRIMSTRFGLLIDGGSCVYEIRASKRIEKMINKAGIVEEVERLRPYIAELTDERAKKARSWENR